MITTRHPPLHERKWIVILVWRRCNSTYMYRVTVLVFSATFNNISRTCIDEFNKDFNRDLWFDLIHILFCTRYIYLFSLNRRYRYDMYVYQGRIQGRAPPPQKKLEKIWFFCVKSWFFTRNTPNIFAPPSVRRNFFKCATPNLKSWIRPCILFTVRNTCVVKYDFSPDHMHFGWLVWYGLWCLTPISTIFQLCMVAVSFIGGWNRSTWRKPLTCLKSLTNFIT